MGKKIVVTGGAGFIGSNYVSRLLSRGEEVNILDNLSRKGAQLNIDWLKNTFGSDSFELNKVDVRDKDSVTACVANADVIVHLAGQVAVTTSVIDPSEDFDINALGTFNVMEGARLSGRNPVVLYASTNKVYGGMEEIAVVEGKTAYSYRDFPFGLAETQNLDFHSPYGCSKGCGDQYVRDYHRIYEIPSVVFRQSCIYGPRQFGIEDQGWVAWFIIAAITGKPISIFGDGKQVRDILYVDDLLNAYDIAISNIDKAAGKIFNIGGGPAQTMSIWNEFAPMLEALLGEDIDVNKSDWRPGDQKVYISDIRKAQEELGWEPAIGVKEGVERLYNWVNLNKKLFAEME